MKIFLRGLLPAFLLFLFCGAAGAQQLRVATVDLRKVFDNYWKTKQADSSLKDRAADMEKEHKTMLTDYNKAKEEYQKLLAGANDLAVSVEEREKRKKSAEDKLKQLKDNEDTIMQYERQAKTTLDEQRRRMRDNIIKEIREVLTAKAKTAGFSLVFDSAADSLNSTPILLYSTAESDLTDSVLAQLNAAAPAEPAKTEEKNEEKKDEKKKDEKKK